GSFTSRLNRNLREVHGYTYGVRSGFNNRRTYGTFTVSTSVKANVTGPALKEMMAELNRITTADITADEARKARETFRTQLTERFGSLDAMLGTVHGLLLLGAPLDSTTQDLAKAAKADANALNSAMKQTIDLKRSVLILVGDKKLILEQIKDLQLAKPVELDADGVRRE